MIYACILLLVCWSVGHCRKPEYLEDAPPGMKLRWSQTADVVLVGMRGWDD